MVAFPLSAALISLVCAAIATRRYATRRRPHELAWSIAFALFALAAAIEVIGSESGWTPLLVRLYYAAGAILNVPFLALGSLFIVLGRRLERWGPGIMAFMVAAALGFVFSTPVDQARLDQGWHALMTRGTPTRWLTIIGSSGGATIIIGVALYSVVAGWRRGLPRGRAVGLVLIAVGTFVIASGGIMVSRFGDEAYLYTTMAPGVAIILLGYLQANRAARKPGVGLPAPPPTAEPLERSTGDMPGTPRGEPAAPAAVATAGYAEADTVPLRPLVASSQPSAGGAAIPPPPGPVAVGVADRPVGVPERGRPSPAPASRVAVRLLGPGDAAAAREVLARSGAAAALAVGVRYRADEALAALLAGDGATWLGAELDGRLVGLVRLVPGDDPATRHTARLDPLAVDCEALGRGVGSALLAEALRWADGHLGLARLATQVYADGERTARFYTDRGFVAEGVARRALFADGRHRDVLLLARTRESA